MFSLGGEGLNIGPPRVALPTVFTCLLVCVLYSDNCRGYESFKGSSELTPCDICDHIYRVKSFTIVSDISRYGGLTYLQSYAFIITSYHLRRCFMFYGGHTSKIFEYLHMVLHHIACDVFTNDSSVCLHLHGSS